VKNFIKTWQYKWRRPETLGQGSRLDLTDPGIFGSLKKRGDGDATREGLGAQGGVIYQGLGGRGLGRCAPRHLSMIGLGIAANYLRS